MKQKFPKLTFVKVAREMPISMEHFEGGFTGIVDGTHSQLYGGKDIDSYSIYMLNRGRIVDQIAWYPESLLKLAPVQCLKKAEQLIEEFNFRR